jgi:predicted ATPase
VPVIGAQIIRFVFDQRATAQCFLARILWLQGFADQAVGLVRTVLDGALAGGDVLSLCQTLVQAACPVAFFVGDLDAAEQHVTLLLDHSRRQGLDFWQAYGRCFEGVLVIKRGEVAEGLAMLGAALDGLRSIQFGVYYNVFVSEFAGALGRVGRYQEGLVAIDEALARAETNEERWYLAESLRIKGELILRSAEPDAAREAERLFRESLDWSRRQETPAWELRASMSLAMLWRDTNRREDARKLLSTSFARFKEGLATADLQTASRLLNELR